MDRNSKNVWEWLNYSHTISEFRSLQFNSKPDYFSDVSRVGLCITLHTISKTIDSLPYYR